MTGVVAADHACLAVTFVLPGRPSLTLEFVVDTGFVGHLTLPVAAEEALELPFVRRITANLADDRTVPVNFHAATIVWNGREQEVTVAALGRRPLLGTKLLWGSELAIRFEERGAVTVVPL